jgi:hypothetical protein
VAGELGAQLTGGTKPNFVNLTRFFPVKEIGTTPLAGTHLAGNVLDTLVGGLNPLAKSPIETALNRDFYWDRPIEEYPDQEKKFLGVSMSPTAKRAASLIRPLNAIEQVSWRGVPASAEDAYFTAGQAVGLRTFPVDVKRQVYEAQRAIDTQVSAVMRDYARARRDAESAGRDWRSDADVQRMAEIYRDLIARKDALPLKALREADRARLQTSRSDRKELKGFATAGR